MEERCFSPWLKAVPIMGRNLTIYESVVYVALAAKDLVKTAAKTPCLRLNEFAAGLARAVANMQRTLIVAQSLLTKGFGKEEATAPEQKARRHYVLFGFTGDKTAAVSNARQERLYSSVKL